MSDPPSGDDAPRATNPTAEVSALLEAVKLAKSEFDSLVTTSTSSIQSEVARAKTAASEAEKIKTDVATAKGAIDATQKSATDELGVVTQSKAVVEKLTASATALSEKLSSDHEALSAQIEALQERQKTLQTVLANVEVLKSSIQTDSESGKASIKEIEATKAALAKLNTDTQAQHSQLEQRQNALQSKIKEIETAHTQITDFRSVLLETKEGRKSIEQQIKELQTQINSILTDASNDRTAGSKALKQVTEEGEQKVASLINTSEKKFGALYEDLKTQILSLLPSAGAAGFSSTYYDAKSRYAPTSFKGKPGASKASGFLGPFRPLLGYDPIAIFSTCFFYAMFMSPLLALVYGTYELVRDLEAHPALDNRIFALRILIAIPLAALSGFGFASLHRYRRLFEEYNHKQRVMELYESFRNEIEKEGDEEQKKALLSIMLKAVSEKAWGDSNGDEGESVISSVDRWTNTLSKLKALTGH